jgi:hypothetical protein
MTVALQEFQRGSQTGALIAVRKGVIFDEGEEQCRRFGP